ncbi:inositol monophosphatase [Mariniplasma anaerobium]|uniref:Inositol monophosphatase n=2 Tax=Mariniplasma anaerobium TaxID=2735436 RepID=A0A7U9TK80_9MOLU|nr:inositol monophosphatase [Mariniplasma anaerobium]
MTYEKELNLIKNVTKKIYEDAILTVKKTSFKGEQDIVTSTDLYIERHLIDAIKSNFSDDFIHSEEYHNKTVLKDRTWLIDPIDGTSNYASNLGLYVVQIALYDKADIVLSYIYAPKFNKTYYAIKGKGAYLNDQKYHVSDQHDPSNFMISMVGLSHKQSETSYFKAILDLAIEHKYKTRMLGSIGLELALTSESIFNLFYTNVTNLWDLCPGVLLVREAGLLVVNENFETYKLGDQHLFVCRDTQTLNIIKEHILNLN